MPFLIAGLLLLWLLFLGMKAFVRGNPATMALVLRRLGAVVALVGGVAMLLRGRVDIAFGFGALAFWLLKGQFAVTAFGTKPRPRRRRRLSRVRSAVIEMELDHDSGAMTGSVLAGPDEGASLDQLNWPRCLALFRRCLGVDPEGARLLEAYFDRRFSGWRQAADPGGDARRANASDAGQRRTAGTMSEDEAHEVLGLAKRASRDEITRAHRALMKKLHPDHGGSTDLAARVNEAKDVLLRRHS